MTTIRQPFEFENWYHVFNHARGNDNIFDSEKEYQLFLKLTLKYIGNIAQIYAYCLMPNHFHFLVQIKEFALPPKFTSKHETDYISHQWGTLQNTYTKKKNYRTGKRGGIFCQSINRNLITSEEYLQKAIVYIHNNPVRHGFCTTPGNWRFSSFNAIISTGDTNIERDEVLSWFENRENFIQYHQSNADDYLAEKFGLK